MRYRNELLLACCACLLLLSGACNRNQGPVLAPVSGTVTLDGKPLAGAGVVFKQEGARKSVAWTDEAGRYELTYFRDDKGAVIGEHKVIITTADSEAEIPESLPARYNQESTLKETVEAGKQNVIDFALTSE